jgi:hypothetical protein
LAVVFRAVVFRTLFFGVLSTFALRDGFAMRFGFRGATRLGSREMYLPSRISRTILPI